MVVDPEVETALRGGSATMRSVLVAGCGERMAQIFIGLCGDDDSREQDVDMVVQMLEDLWDANAESNQFSSYLENVSEFSEFEDSDEELVEVEEIYTFYAVLALRYSVQYRVTMDVDYALRCAHSCLTAMAQLAQNVTDSGVASAESEFQRQAVLSEIGNSELAEYRSRCRDEGRKRLRIIARRIE